MKNGLARRAFRRGTSGVGDKVDRVLAVRLSGFAEQQAAIKKRRKLTEK